MQKTYLWTQSKARLQFIRANSGECYNWIFLPGGPRIGSESLNGLTQILSLPGAAWHLDLPGDGSNITSDDSYDFANWSKALLEAVSALKNVILVAHSTGGMYALATAALEKILTGLVLMDSAPDATWQQAFAEYVKKYPLAVVEQLQKLYEQSPSNETLKQATIASAPYFMTKHGLKKSIDLLESLPFNYKSHAWSAKYFDETYKAAWIPKKLPTLILLVIKIT